MRETVWIGVDVGGTWVKYVVTDATGGILRRGETATDRDDPAATLATLATRLRDEVESVGEGTLAGLGLACAGIVSPAAGRLGRSPNLPGWEGADLRDLALDTCGRLTGAGAGADLPPALALANDVNAALYGEWCLGAGRDCRHLVMIALGTGVGGGILTDGVLLTGSHHAGAEIGHLVLDPEGPPCTCGGRGCLESYAGGVALRRRAIELAAAEGVSAAFAGLAGGPDATPPIESLADLARAGDPTARWLFTEAGRRLGQAVAGLIVLLDPDRVILGGGVAQAGELLLEPCRETARRLVRINTEDIPLVSAVLGPHAAALGAACLVRREVAGA